MIGTLVRSELKENRYDPGTDTLVTSYHQQEVEWAACFSLPAACWEYGPARFSVWAA